MGASSGIGRATALELARRGATVVVAARGEPALDTLVAQIRADGGTASAVVADVTIAQDMHRVAQHAVTTQGRLDTWVHVAGVLLVAGFENTTPEEFARVVQVNLLGQVHGANAALPALRERGGAFISISSMGAKRSIPLQSAYCASKHGLDGFLEALRIDCSTTPSRSASPRSCPRRSTHRCLTTPAPRSGSNRPRRRPATQRPAWRGPWRTRPSIRSGTSSSAARRRR